MFFKPRGRLELGVDIHSHLVPGVDDGVKTIDEAIEIILKFKELGYSKLVTTPHISEAYYPNTPESLRESFDLLREELIKRSIDIQLELGAEYMVDGELLKSLQANDEILSWNGYVLIETGFQMFPIIFDEVIFQLQSKGISPVLAHPERYEYLFGKVDKVRSMRESGVLMQVSSSSLVGYYGPDQKKMAQLLVKESLVDFIGSDVHRLDQMAYLDEGLKSKVLRKLPKQTFRNHSLF